MMKTIKALLTALVLLVSGPAAVMPQSPSGQEADIETLLMKLQSEGASVLDGKIADQMDAIQRQKDLMNEINAGLGGVSAGESIKSLLDKINEFEKLEQQESELPAETPNINAQGIIPRQVDPAQAELEMKKLQELMNKYEETKNIMDEATSLAISGKAPQSSGAGGEKTKQVSEFLEKFADRYGGRQLRKPADELLGLIKEYEKSGDNGLPARIHGKFTEIETARQGLRKKDIEGKKKELELLRDAFIKFSEDNRKGLSEKERELGIKDREKALGRLSAYFTDAEKEIKEEVPEPVLKDFLPKISWQRMLVSEALSNMKVMQNMLEKIKAGQAAAGVPGQKAIGGLFGQAAGKPEKKTKEEKKAVQEAGAKQGVIGGLFSQLKGQKTAQDEEEPAEQEIEEKKSAIGGLFGQAAGKKTAQEKKKKKPEQETKGSQGAIGGLFAQLKEPKSGGRESTGGPQDKKSDAVQRLQEKTRNLSDNIEKHTSAGGFKAGDGLSEKIGDEAVWILDWYIENWPRLDNEIKALNQVPEQGQKEIRELLAGEQVFFGLLKKYSEGILNLLENEKPGSPEEMKNNAEIISEKASALAKTEKSAGGLKKYFSQDKKRISPEDINSLFGKILDRLRELKKNEKKR